MSRAGYLVGCALLLVACDGRAQSPAAPSAVTPAGWQTYVDAGHGFAVAYPPDSVVWQTGPMPDLDPPVLARVRVMNREVAAGAFADREPAQLTVDVFAPAGSGTLRGWLQRTGRLPAGAAVEAATVQGAREALHVQLRQAIAPNEFVYVATDRFLYAITPLGEAGDRMRATFRLLP